jgi:hypothetical protein
MLNARRPTGLQENKIAEFENNRGSSITIKGNIF